MFICLKGVWGGGGGDCHSSSSHDISVFYKNVIKLIIYTNWILPLNSSRSLALKRDTISPVLPPVGVFQSLSDQGIFPVAVMCERCSLILSASFCDARSDSTPMHAYMTVTMLSLFSWDRTAWKISSRRPVLCISFRNSATEMKIKRT